MMGSVMKIVEVECSSSVQFSSVAQLCPTLCDPMNRSTPGLPLHHQLPESTQTHVHWVMISSNHLIFCRLLLLLPSIFPSIRVFSNESALPIKWPKYWSFSFNISPSNEHPGLISCRMDWLNLLAVQGTLKSLLQHHSSKASILGHSAVFIVQFSHPYMTTGKTIALTRWTFVGKVMSLLFNMLSRLVIGEGDSTPLQYSCLENPMDGGVWKAAIHGVTEDRTRLSDFTFTFHFHALEKEMETHSSVLAWRIPGTVEPGGLPDVYGVAQSRTRLKRLSSSS